MIKFKYLGKLTLGLAGCALLAACSRSVDVREVETIRGLLYKHKAEDPFTGTITNYQEADNSFRGRGICELQVKNGLPHGALTCTSNAGRPLAAIQFQEGKKHGTEEIWEPKEGGLMRRISWKGGVLDGLAEYFNPSTGKIVSRVNWRAGQKEGEEKGWDILGDTLLIDLHWQAGRKTGTHKWGGFEGSFKDGQLHGIQRRYVIAVNRQADFTKWDPHIALIGGGGYAFSQAADSVLVEETLYENGVKVRTNIDVGAQQKAEQEAKREAETIAGKHGCVNAWMASYRKERGQDAAIYAPQMEEWGRECAESRLPKS
jgi:antitoxin component YwqK of YwqJK toxin-antitoxin module